MKIYSFPILAADHSGGCGINDETLQWMDAIQNSAVENDADNDDDIIDNKPITNLSQKQPNRLNAKKQATNNPNSIFEDDLKYPHLKYSKEANYNDDTDYTAQSDRTNDEWHEKSHERAKRAARPKEDNKNTCSLYIQTDPLIWRHIREGIADVSYSISCS